MNLKIGSRCINESSPAYFIADIGANHDGSLKRAKKLIHMCADSGANAAKFQHFKAETIVSDVGFKRLDSKYLSHQLNWTKSVFEVYRDASIDTSWDNELKSTCDQCGIDYMTTPYDKGLVDHIDPLVHAYKVGSGDITWIQHIKYIASKGKPVLLACGAATLDDVVRAVTSVLELNSDVAVLQCNTNYTGHSDNLNYVNLNVIRTLKSMFPSLCIGLSDHTQGHATAIGAVALGCKIIEKHFTDDNSRTGPDHGFAMDPKSWKLMVDTTRELERALGSGIKKIEQNEKDTVVIQRRSIRANRMISRGEFLMSEAVEMLRPCPVDALEPWEIDNYIGRRVLKDIHEGDYLRASDFES